MKVDMQKPVVKPRIADLDTFRQYESLLELSRGNPAMQEYLPLTVIRLPATDDELVILLRDMQIVHDETRHGQRDAQRGLVELFDIVGRIPVGCGFGGALKHLLEMIEPQKHRRCE